MKRISDPWLREKARDRTVLLGPIRRHVESAQFEREERPRGIHPSALCRDDFCVRAAFYDISGRDPLDSGERLSHRITSIMDEGTAIHEKWQGWAWSMGALIGVFGCLLCRHANSGPSGGDPLAPRELWTWWGQAPKDCPRCGATGRHFLRYLEIPISDPDLLIVGHADIRVGDKLGEIKSVGLGTVEIELPRLYNRHTHKVSVEGEERTMVDLQAIWNGIKRPFLVHTRQLQIYLYCTGLDQGFVLYETKWNQAPKEFPVPFHFPTVEPLIELCYDVRYAMDKDKPPYCNQDSISGCPKCRAYEETM